MNDLGASRPAVGRQLGDLKIVQWLSRIPAWLFVALPVAVGIAERSLWNLMRTAQEEHSEALNVAVSFAQGRGFADAFKVGQGPTAHILPISPAVAGTVYAVFGVGSATSEFVLGCWSIGLAVGTYFLLFRAFEHLGSARPARLLALAFGCMAPTYLAQEAVDFRIWEGGLAVFLCALFLERLLAALAGEQLGTRVLAGISFIAALLFFVNPVLGIGAYLCAAVACLQRLHGVQILRTVALATLILAIFLTPWVIRNQIALGSPVLLRSNAGLEISLANYPGALDPIDPQQRFMHRLQEIHPFSSESNYQAMLGAGGEVAYSRQLGSVTWHWIGANRWTTAKTALLHLRQLFAPQPWQFKLSGSGLLAGLRAGLASLIGLLGLVGIARALVLRQRHWVFPAVLVLAPALCFSLFQPVPRYTYLFYPILIFCAADLLTPRSRQKTGPIGA
jgi:hypothetical protein